MAIRDLFDRLHEDPEGAHRFEPGIPPDLLRTLQKALGFDLPYSFRSFLGLANGATLFSEVTLLGLHDEGSPMDLRTFARSLSALGLPSDLVPFARFPDGCACFYVGAGPRDQELPVVLWSPEEGRSEISHESFDEWLFDLTEGLRDLGVSGVQKARPSADSQTVDLPPVPPRTAKP